MLFKQIYIFIKISKKILTVISIFNIYDFFYHSNTDVPGMVAKISALLAQAKVNIAEMRLYRSGRGKRAAFIAECDQEIPAATIAAIRALEGIKKVSYLSLEDTPCRTIR